jgi:hypothetical protein
MTKGFCLQSFTGPRGKKRTDRKGYGKRNLKIPHIAFHGLGVRAVGKSVDSWKTRVKIKQTTYDIIVGFLPGIERVRQMPIMLRERDPIWSCCFCDLLSGKHSMAA